MLPVLPRKRLSRHASRVTGMAMIGSARCHASGHEANLSTARNAILLRSYCMASLQKSTLLSAVLDKSRRFFGKGSTQRLPGDLHSATNPPGSPSTTSQQIFKKSNDARRDMSILAMTYILQDKPTIRELILLIISLNDHDDSDKVCTTCSPS